MKAEGPIVARSSPYGRTYGSFNRVINETNCVNETRFGHMISTRVKLPVHYGNPVQVRSILCECSPCPVGKVKVGDPSTRPGAHCVSLLEQARYSLVLSLVIG